MQSFSIVIPCYNEEQSLTGLFEAVSETVSGIKDRYAVTCIFVDDGSKDGTLTAIKALRSDFIKIEYISFSRNFGKESAMLAGIRKSKGDLVAILDSDLQHPPHYLLDMLREMEGGECDMVAMRRVSRKGDPVVKSWMARWFYRFVNRISETDIADGVGDYRLMKRIVADAVLQLPEYHRFSKGLFAWVGFRTKYLEYENVERVAGESKWSFFKLLRYAIDGIVSFSAFPLRIASIIGGAVSCVALVYLICVLVEYFTVGIDVPGYPTMICAVLLAGGLILLALGIIGEYLARTYEQVKHRPLYLVREETPGEKE